MGKRSKGKKKSKPEASSMNNESGSDIQPKDSGNLESLDDTVVQDFEMSEPKSLDTTPTNFFSLMRIQESPVENTHDIQTSKECTDELHLSTGSLETKSKKKSKKGKKRKDKPEDGSIESKRQDFQNIVESTNQKSNMPIDDQIIESSDAQFSKSITENHPEEQMQRDDSSPCKSDNVSVCDNQIIESSNAKSLKLGRESPCKERTQQDNVSNGAECSKPTTENSFKKRTQHENVNSDAQFSGPTSENHSEKRTQLDDGHSSSKSRNMPACDNQIIEGGNTKRLKSRIEIPSKKRTQLDDSRSSSKSRDVSICDNQNTEGSNIKGSKSRRESPSKNRTQLDDGHSSNKLRNLPACDNQIIEGGNTKRLKSRIEIPSKKRTQLDDSRSSSKSRDVLVCDNQNTEGRNTRGSKSRRNRNSKKQRQLDASRSSSKSRNDNQISEGSNSNHSKPRGRSRSKKRIELENSSPCKSNTTVNISKSDSKYLNRKEEFSNKDCSKSSEKRKNNTSKSPCKSNTTVNISKPDRKYTNQKKEFSNENNSKSGEKRKNHQCYPDSWDTDNEYESVTELNDTLNESLQLNQKSQSWRDTDNESKSITKLNDKDNESWLNKKSHSGRYEKKCGNKSTDQRNSCKESEKKPVKSVVREIRGDLFTADDEYSLAHCVAEDFRMGAGIALQFRKKFGGAGELLDQKARTGDVAFLKRGDRYIYYLVTKRCSNLKPTLITIGKSIRKLQNLCKEHNVKKLAMPLIGCGLDRLYWEDVKDILEVEFKDTDVQIVAYQYDEVESASPGNTKRPKSLSVRTVSYPLVEIEAQTALVVFGSLDGFANKTCHRLETKYTFIKKYENECKKGEVELGHFIPILTNCEYVSVFLIKNRASDPFQFNCLEQCIREFNKFLNKENYFYVGIEISEDEEDPALNEKILTVFQHFLSQKVELYVCNSPSARY